MQNNDDPVFWVEAMESDNLKDLHGNVRIEDMQGTERNFMDV